MNPNITDAVPKLPFLNSAKSIQSLANSPSIVHATLPTAVDNMSPTHNFIRTLSASPIAPGVAVHSIVAVQGVGDLSGLSDGVVRYQSAHLDGIGTEKVVHSSHSMQAEPDTVLEVRRILREHLGIR